MSDGTWAALGSLVVLSVAVARKKYWQWQLKQEQQKHE